MGREIRCTGCNKYLGNIIEAKLHKEIRFLCSQCNTKRIASDMSKKRHPVMSDQEAVDFLKGTFGFK